MDAEALTFDEEAAMEAARERNAVPHLSDILRREHDRIIRGHRRDVALEKWGPLLDEMMMRDLKALEGGRQRCLTNETSLIQKFTRL